ncbi:MAG: ABC transporter ATP-binding protein [Campylobacterota bacterium]|nr:ABC transporter ATP-binding protein [Campylobacterota bacterium]
MIYLKNITKQYSINKNDTISALKDINLNFKEGSVNIIKGASGSGKSTILSLIAGFSKPTTGEVIVDTKRISKLPDDFLALYRRENIGFIFQKYNLIPNITVKDNILLPLIPNNPNEKDLNKKIDKVIKQFNITNKKDIIVKNLSGGEQQRVAISRAMINEPKIIIADEPTANLDKKLSVEFCDIIKDLKDSNKTIIIATHDPIFFSLDFIDNIIDIKNGIIKSSINK